jgi:hypothetical protein
MASISRPSALGTGRWVAGNGSLQAASPLVAMMETADLWERHDLAHGGRLDGRGSGACLPWAGASTLTEGMILSRWGPCSHYWLALWSSSSITCSWRSWTARGRVKWARNGVEGRGRVLAHDALSCQPQVHPPRQQPPRVASFFVDRILVQDATLSSTLCCCHALPHPLLGIQPSVDWPSGSRGGASLHRERAPCDHIPG